jgi:Rieske Fe-S protein
MATAAKKLTRSGAISYMHPTIIGVIASAVLTLLVIVGSRNLEHFDSAILVRASDENFYAYGQKCTHLSCPVYYDKQSMHLECPCHEGGFDAATGNVLYGPPPRALDKIELEMRGTEVWAIGRKASGSDENNQHGI